MNKIFLVFRNKRVIAVAADYKTAEELKLEFEAAEGVIKNVNFSIVETEGGDFIDNLTP